MTQPTMLRETTDGFTFNISANLAWSARRYQNSVCKHAGRSVAPATMVDRNLEQLTRDGPRPLGCSGE
jgi:hypothetical protein